MSVTTHEEAEWVRAAMSDDLMVVELLVRLHHAPPSRPPPPPRAPLPMKWSVRQRRSRWPVSANNKKRAHIHHRGSPSTPLSSWTSHSGGSEDSVTEPTTAIDPSTSATRSKPVSTDGEKSAAKRPRKKKTLSELKDEEDSLLKERRELKKEMVSLRRKLESQRAANQNLKRMKVELQPLQDGETIVIAKASTSQLQLKSSGNEVSLQSSTSNSCPEQQQNADDEESDHKFILPDLNMLFEEEPTPDVICEVR